MATHAEHSIKGADVTEVVKVICNRAGSVMTRIQVDNGSEFIFKAFDQRAYENFGLLMI